MSRFSRLVVILAIIGVAGVDAVSLLLGRVQMLDDANNAASVASASWQSSHNANQALAQAQTELSHGEVLVPDSFVIARDGSVSLRLQRVVSTLVAKDLPGTTSWTHLVLRGSAPAPTL